MKADRTLIRETDAEREHDASKPVLFVHIPKTAGTSFLLMLQNVFGDNRVLRLTEIGRETDKTVASIVANDLGALSCLTGHLQYWMLAPHIHRFRAFTVLREPVARVLSLYRFTMARGPEHLRRLGLPPNASLAEFLGSHHPEIFGQVVNGMTRQLCGDPRVDDPDDQAFWNANANLNILNAAARNLEAMDFGLAEDMAGTLRIARACWDIPYPLREYRENQTRTDERYDLADLYKITQLNALDITLHRQAQTLFRTRLRLLEAFSAPDHYNPSTIFSPSTSNVFALGDVPGRQGFDEFEHQNNFAWIRSDSAAELNFRLPTSSAGFELKLYCVVPNYPVEQLNLILDGAPLPSRFNFVNKYWGCLETVPFNPTTHLQRLQIHVPVFIPARSLDSTSADNRHLGVALAQISVVWRSENKTS